MIPQKICIADDHSIVRMGLKILIQNLYKDTIIVEEEYGQKIFDTIKINLPIDLIILDVHMDDIDPFVLIRNIKRITNAKIIMFTIANEEVYAERFLSIGASAFLNKSASDFEIEKLIKKVLKNDNNVQTQAKFHKNNKTGKLSLLAPREFEVANLLSQEIATSEISKILSIAPNTVSTMKSRIFDKLQINKIKDLAKLLEMDDELTS